MKTLTYPEAVAEIADNRIMINTTNEGTVDYSVQLVQANLPFEKGADSDANGNYVYNGSFQEGDKHLGYWDVANADAAVVSVTSLSDGRRLKVAMNEDAAAAVVLSQDELAFAEGKPYALSFTAESDIDNKLTVMVGGKAFEVEIPAGSKQSYTLALSETEAYVDHNISFTFGTKGTTWLDDVRLVENAMIKNGSFNDGLTGYEVYADSSAKATFGVDSLKNDNALAVTVEKTSDQDWKIQVKQNNVKLEQGKWSGTGRYQQFKENLQWAVKFREEGKQVNSLWAFLAVRDVKFRVRHRHTY